MRRGGDVQPARLGRNRPEILNDAKSTDQIVTNGLGLQGQRYSTTDALNTNNINQLRPVWGSLWAVKSSAARKHSR